MMNTKKLSTFKRLFMLSVVLVLSLASTLTLTACGSKIPENTVFSVDDLAGKSVGVQLGTTGDIYVSDMVQELRLNDTIKEMMQFRLLSRARLMLL